MDTRYKYGHRPGRRRRTRVLIVMVVSLLILGTIGTFVYLDLKKNQGKPVETTGRTIAQTLDEATETKTLDDALFSLELPGDWKEISKANIRSGRSITWQATKYREDNRSLTIYIDDIPADYAVNRMLPLSARGNELIVGEVSDLCSSFTKGGVAAAGQAELLTDKNAKYQGVDFLCELSKITDNQVGTSSAEGINKINITGPNKGKHSYFFLYIDRNIQPNYSIIYNALRSFKAK